MTIFHADQRTLGTLIAELRDCPPEHPVAFDFCGRAPNGIHPCPPARHLAIGHSAMHEAQRPTVARLLNALYGAIHQRFLTREGHEFTAGEDTPLWVGDAGEPSSTVIVGIYRREVGVFLRTDHWSIA